jgi:WD40 repeat protein
MCIQHRLALVCVFLAVSKPAWCQTKAKAEPLCTLRIVEKEHDPKLSWYAPRIVFAQNKENTVVYFTMLSNWTVGQWDLPKLAPAKACITSNRFRKFPHIECSTISGLTASRDGRLLLIQHAPPLTLTFGSSAGDCWGMLESDSAKHLVWKTPSFFELLDIEQSKSIWKTQSKNEHFYTYSALAADGANLIYVLSDKPSRVVLWDVAAAKELRSFPDLIGPVALAPDGKTFAAHKSSAPSEPVLLDATSGTMVASLTLPATIDTKPRETLWRPDELLFAPDGKTIAGFCSERGWVVWNLEGKIVVGQEAKTRPSAFCYRPDGTWATAAAPVQAIAYSPDGKLYASGDNGVINVWDASKR